LTTWYTRGTERVFKWWDYPIFAALTVALLAVLAYFLVYWFSRRDLLYYPVPFVLITGGFLLYLLLYQLRWLCLPLMRRPLSMTPRPDWKVGVATTFVPGAESINMLEETVRALLRIFGMYSVGELSSTMNPSVSGTYEKISCKSGRRFSISLDVGK
jgi:hypothetical protein